MFLAIFRNPDNSHYNWHSSQTQQSKGGLVVGIMVVGQQFNTNLDSCDRKDWTIKDKNHELKQSDKDDAWKNTKIVTIWPSSLPIFFFYLLQLYI